MPWARTVSAARCRPFEKADSATDHLRDAGGVAQTAAKKLQEVLDETEKLNKTVDDYIPQAQQALTDAKALTEPPSPAPGICTPS